MSEYIVGIDIGSSKICSAAGRIDKQGRLQIVGVTSVNCSGLKKGIVIDIDSTAESIRNCMDQLNGMIDAKIASAYISIPGGICELVPSRGVIAISSEDKEINNNDVLRVLNAAKVMSKPSTKEIVGVVPIQYIIDGYENIKDPIGMSGLKLEVEANVVLAQTTIVTNLVKTVNKAGIKVEGIVVEPVAISEVAFKKEELKIGAALVDIGAEKTDITLYRDGNILYSGVLPFGGNTITNDLSVCLKVPFSEAEKLKIKYGTLEMNTGINKGSINVNIAFNDTIKVSNANIIEIIEARVEELLQLVKNKIDDSGFSDDISGVVLVGGGLSFFSGICELGRSIFNMPVRIGSPDYTGAASPIYNTVVGIIKDVTCSSTFTKIKNGIEESSSFKEKEIRKKVEASEESGVLTKIKGFLADFF